MGYGKKVSSSYAGKRAFITRGYALEGLLSMRVDSQGRIIATPQSGGSVRRTGSGSTFQLPQETPQTSASGGTQAVHSTAGLDALIALQALDLNDETEAKRRRKAMARGQNLLDVLDELRIAVLQGTVPAALLTRLSRTLSEDMETLGDAQLNTLLQEIDLRAQVELAKLSR